MRNITIKLDLLDAIKGMPDEDLGDLIDFFSTDDRVIENVPDQLLCGFTELQSRASVSGEAGAAWAGENPTALERCRRRLLAEFPEEISKEAVSIARAAEEERRRHAECLGKSEEKFYELMRENTRLLQENTRLRGLLLGLSVAVGAP